MKKRHVFCKMLTLIFTTSSLLVANSSALQAETLCQQNFGATYQIIYGGTPASNNLTSGQIGVVIWLKGNLTIDQNFTMNGWVIKADPGKSVFVNENVMLSVANSKLYCCNGLWSGILVMKNAKLAMKQCIVEDA